LWSLCDENKDGRISFNEFLNKLVSNVEQGMFAMGTREQVINIREQ
jgi:hypothetical protein